jgi:Spy/CpxP family protein refolding chaperone
MKISTLGAIVASTVVGLVGSVAHAAAGASDAKACYRPHCGKSVKGHEGKCGGMKVDALTTQTSCESAGGAWTTAAEAKKFESKHE